MKYVVKHDTKGRLRIRCGKFAFSAEEGYGIAAGLQQKIYVTSVSTNHTNGSILVIYDPKHRDEVLNYFDNIKKTDLVCCEPSDHDVMAKTDLEFQQAVAASVVRRFIMKNFMPAPIRIGVTLFRAAGFIAHGVSSLLKCDMNVSVLDAAAISAALVQGDYSSASSVMFLLNLSGMIEDYTRKRTRNALSNSLALNVDTVWLCHEDGTQIQVPMEKVQTGDKIVIRMGSVIPFDGNVVDGEAMVNEAAMTGEPLSVLKKDGSSVFAGTVVEEGSVVIEVRALSSESRLSKIIELIDRSEGLKAGVQSRAENLADSIVPFSFVTSIATYLVTRNITKAMSVLMVDYSCAIKLSVPISVVSAMREAASHKIMVKGGKFLENFAEADTIVFDKTGTLTQACPQVAEVIAVNDFSKDYVLKTAACLEEHFPHSVAKAIVAKALEEGLHHEEEHAEVEYVVAHGIASKIGDNRAIIGSAHFVFDDEDIKFDGRKRNALEKKINGRSAVYLAIGDKLAGAICINDPVKEEAADVLKELRKYGVKNIIMLTGDSESAAKSACQELGIDSYRAQVLPEDKASVIESIKSEGHKVIMVGDGVNDSPALSAADVSVSMKDSSDIAKEVADISLLSANLHSLVTLRKLSMEVMKKINKNYRFIIGFNTMLLALGITGVITPQTSAICHNMSTMGISALSMRPCLKK